MPANSPPQAGTKSSLPMEADSSMDGISRDQTEAATMTPEAKPRSAFCTFAPSSFFRKNTQAAPRVVPKNGIISPKNTVIKQSPLHLPFLERQILLYSVNAVSGKTVPTALLYHRGSDFSIGDVLLDRFYL